MKLLDIRTSTSKGKKLMAIFCKCTGCTKCKPEERKVVHFGATGYSDYTIHKDEKRRSAYRARHATGKNAPADTPNALAYHLLWGDSTSLQQNIKAFKKRYGV